MTSSMMKDDVWSIWRGAPEVRRRSWSFVPWSWSMAELPCWQCWVGSMWPLAITSCLVDIRWVQDTRTLSISFNYCCRCCVGVGNEKEWIDRKWASSWIPVLLCPVLCLVCQGGRLCGWWTLEQQSIDQLDSDAYGRYLAGALYHHVLGVAHHLCFSDGLGDQWEGSPLLWWTNSKCVASGPQPEVCKPPAEKPWDILGWTDIIIEAPWASWLVMNVMTNIDKYWATKCTRCNSWTYDKG